MINFATEPGSISPVMLFISFVVGMGVGAFYFGGLWWTVCQLTNVQQPAWLFLTSFVMRIGLSLAVIYWIVDGSIVRIMICMGGFLLMRMWMIRYWGIPSTLGA